jgi:yersiniabactin nonribosomal peptide synthetase
MTMEPSSGRAGRQRRARSATADPLTLESMRLAVAGMLGQPPAEVGDSDDLIHRGVDSMHIMRLANTWRRAGVDLKFAELIECPTLGAWWALASGRGATADRQPTVQSAETLVDEGAPFALSPMQKAYWVGERDAQVLGGVSAHFYVEFDGSNVAPRRLEGAVRAVIQRHGMLRARFLKDATQQILAESPWSGVTVHDLRDRGEASSTAALQQIRERLSKRRLRIDRGEVFDVQLSLLPDDRTRLHINISMIACDAQSFQIVLGDLAAAYMRPDLPSAPIGYSFARYLAEQAARRTEAHARGRAYWTEQLATLPGAPQLPLAVEPDRLTDHGINRRFEWLSPAERSALGEHARANGLTLPVALATAFAEVLAAWSAEPRFLLNVPLFDREDFHPEVPALVGDFTNVITLSVEADRNLSFAKRAGVLQARLAANVSHAEYSGAEVLRDLARMRPGDWMMAPVVFTSAIGMGDLFNADVRRGFGQPVWTISQTPQVWLDYQVTERDDGLLVNWDVVEELFPAGVLDTMFEAYIRLLRVLADEAHDWSGPLPALLPEPQEQVRAAVNATHGPWPDGLLHAEFFKQAETKPERMALAWGETESLSYGELADRALRVARLLQQRSVVPGDTVAITLPRGPDQIAAVLGVLAAGAAYVPVGIEQPPRRRAEIYRDAGVRTALVDSRVNSADWPDGVEPLTVAMAEGIPASCGPVDIDPDALAYVIYTSGSTGTPKGVEITHAAAMNTIADINARFEVGPADLALGVSALDFDLSAYDIFGMLGVGATLVLLDDDNRREARRWVELVTRWRITVWNSVPALLDMLLVAAGREGLPSLRLALVSGDWIGLDLPQRVFDASDGCRCIALGGATEAAIWSNVFEVSTVLPSWRSIPYGRPLRNQRFRVVDSRGRDCPDWVPGELWIGGKGVARGYRGDAQRSTAQFVEHQGGRWYRTGDIGRYWPDGTLEFLGRADHQVKIRGHRIELGEIEAALERHPMVAQASVVPIGNPFQRIAAAVVGVDGNLDSAELRPFLSDRLPAYMIPSELVVLSDLPLTANGKVDGKALAELISDQAVGALGERARGQVETAISQLWAELLGVADVGRSNSFFALGGDSLIATRLVDAIGRRFGVDVSLRHFFAAPTVAELAALVDAGVTSSSEEAIEEGVI